MALSGLGAVAIWHDIVPEGRENFYAWHGHQHMLERVSIPGFLRGRRYVSISDGPEFFNLYETDSPDIVSGPAYLERLNNPTPWTLESVPAFRNVSRSLCEVVATLGRADGGLLGTFRYGVHDDQRAAHRNRLSTELLPEWAQRAGVAGCHLLCADEAASAVKTVEKSVRREDNLIPPWIVLLEGWGDEQAFAEFCRSQLESSMFTHAMSSLPTLSMYRLQAAVTAER